MPESRSLAALLVAVIFLGASGSGASAATSAYYVSPKGSDSNAGVSADKPFATLERARTALRASTTTKTVYLLGGVYSRATTLTLSREDAGESWLGYPGQTPILDGGGKTKTAIAISGVSVTVRWLTIRDFVDNGILARNAPGTIIDSDTVLQMLSTGWSQGAIHAANNFTKGRITHNLVRGAGYCGIIVDTKAGDDISGLQISGNAVYDACKRVADCGAIYADDRGHASVDIVISSNLIGDYGTRSNKSKGIYLDDELSNARVFNNVVYGSGDWALMIHGGDHDVISNNVFDISGATALALYEDDTPGRNYGMGGNAFRCNIVYSTAAAPARLWDYHAWKKIEKPAVSDNLYWAGHGAFPDSSAVKDARPLVTDPSFTAPARGDYRYLPAKTPATCGAIGMPLAAAGPLPNPALP